MYTHEFAAWCRVCMAGLQEGKLFLESILTNAGAGTLEASPTSVVVSAPSEGGTLARVSHQGKATCPSHAASICHRHCCQMHC